MDALRQSLSEERAMWAAERATTPASGIAVESLLGVSDAAEVTIDGGDVGRATVTRKGGLHVNTSGGDGDSIASPQQFAAEVRRLADALQASRDDNNGLRSQLAALSSQLAAAVTRERETLQRAQAVNAELRDTAQRRSDVEAARNRFELAFLHLRRRVRRRGVASRDGTGKDADAMEDGSDGLMTPRRLVRASRRVCVCDGDVRARVCRGGSDSGGERGCVVLSSWNLSCVT
jgi:hypothetical protein